MKILVVCHRFPYPPNRGGGIRPSNVIKHLSASHQVYVASLTGSQEEDAAASGIAPFCHEYVAVRVHESVQALRMVARLPTLVPSSMGYFYSRLLARRIQHCVHERRIELVLVYSSNLAPCVARLDQPIKILDFCDMDSQKWLAYSREHSFPSNFGYWIEGQKLKRAEKRLAERFDFCTTATPAEKIPQLKLQIVGAEPPRSIRNLGKRPGVTVTGPVSDVRPFVWRSALTVAPLSIARRTQNKILESRAMGVPVVCSRLASKGVDAIAGEHLLTAESPENYVEAISRVILDPSLRGRLAMAGRARMLTHHDWAGSMRRLDRIIEEAVNRRRAATGSGL